MCLLQMRYAAGSKDVLDRFFNNKPLKKDDVIVEVSQKLYLPFAEQLPAWCSVCSLGLSSLSGTHICFVACQDAC